MSNSAYSIHISGQVQGVGFRPFVYNLARRLGVAGYVTNTPDGVELLAQGRGAVLDRFVAQLQTELPPMALIEQFHYEQVVPIALSGFSINSSVQGEVSITATPDAAVCWECVDELFNPADRRYHYPFINCTNCGPRYSIIRALPYDRPFTTMDHFRLCPDCENEYQDPGNRRFHAQPNACPVCGPVVSYVDGQGYGVDDDPIATAAAQIRKGEIVAVKGVGGFHLLCDARNSAAVARLRERKQRPNKPFAVMGCNARSLGDLVQLNEQQKARLEAQDAPVVLSPFCHDDTLSGIAPGLAWCGVMLPHAPLHYLLMHQLCGCPEGSDWLKEEQTPLVVMTSGNRSGNPLITDNQQALKQLNGIADGFLLHNRDIHIRCDDSVINGLSKQLPLIRRGRGLAPQVIRLPVKGPSTLAVGGFYKNTICVTKEDRAYVSQYIGDLDNPDCCATLNRMAEHLLTLLDITPDQVACDLHPDFYSSRFAREFSQTRGIPLIEVQHHQAHAAAVLAEQQTISPAIGLILDGLGLGTDGALWGGEILRLDEGTFQRLSHLAPLKLPGGDRASAEPWRVAAGILHGLTADELTGRFPYAAAETVSQMLNRDLNCPQTSSAGRLFDAVASLLNICHINSYEAQAAMQLESSAYGYINRSGWPETEPLWQIESNGQLNFRPLLMQLSECTDKAFGAALFHRQFIDGLSGWVLQQCKKTTINRVALAGGCFLNQLLLEGVSQQLSKAGIQVLTAERLPCNDGGLSLGQAYIALMQSQNLTEPYQNNKEITEDTVQCV